MAVIGAISNKPTVTTQAFKPVTTPTPTQQAQTQTTDRGKFFSGGIVKKAFDILQVPEYAYAGFGKGATQERERQRQEALSKGQNINRGTTFGEAAGRFVAGVKNIPSAIANRTSISTQAGDFNAASEASKIVPGLKNKTAQNVYNFATSLAMPTLPIAEGVNAISKGLSKVPIATKIGSKIANIAEKGIEFAKNSPKIAAAVETVNPFFRNPEFGAKLAEAESKSQQRVSQLYRTVTDLTKGLDSNAQVEIGKLIEGGPEARAVATNPVFVDIANKVSQMADDVGREAVDLGLLDAQSFEKYKGKYMSHIWEDTLSGTNKAGIAPNVSGKFFKQRKGAEGFVEQFAPATFKGLGTEMKDIEAAKFYKGIAEQYGVKMSGATPEELLKAATGNYKNAEDVAQLRNAKSLKGMLVPPEVHDYLIKTMPKDTRGFAGKAFDSVFNTWKAGKTVWNPAYHVRNIISNQLLSNMSTGKTVVGTVIDYIGDVANYFGKGNQAYVNAAQDVGLINKVQVGTAFNELLDSAMQLEKNKGLKGAATKAADFVKNFQNTSEETAKLGVFRSWVEQLAEASGKTAEQGLQDPAIVQRAMAEAEKAIFSPYRIAKSERELVGRIIPFYSFSRQLIPFVAETAYKRPGTLKKFPKIKTGVESFSDKVIPDSERDDYQKDTIQLPIKVNGENISFDPTYIYPFGNIGEADFAKGQLPGGLSLNPLISEPFQQIANKDFYFQQPIQSSQIPGVGTDVLSSKPRRAGSQRLAHTIRTLAPTAYNTVQGKLAPALKNEPDYAGRTRSKGMAVLDALGIKTQVLRPEDKKKFDSYDKKTKLNLINKERRSISTDPRLSAEQRRTLLAELDQVRKETLQGKLD